MLLKINDFSYTTFKYILKFNKINLSTKDSLTLTHSGLDVKRFDILPSFLQQGNQEVNRHIQVSSDFIFAHANSSNSGTQTEHFFQLESNINKIPHSLSNFLNFSGGLFTFSHHDGELTDLNQDITQ